jgi:hypothetical protein
MFIKKKKKKKKGITCFRSMRYISSEMFARLLGMEEELNIILFLFIKGSERYYNKCVFFHYENVIP